MSLDFNWEPIGNYVDTISGFAFKSKYFIDDGVPVIKIKNIVPPDVVLEDTQYVSDTFLIEKSNYVLTKGDILITLTGSNVNQMASAVGQVAKISFDEPCLLNQRVAKLIPKDTSKCNIDYFYYILSTEEMHYNLASRASGSANQANINPTIIKSMEALVPPIEIQNKIVTILKTIDDKININKEINKNLQALSKSLLKYHLEDFKPYLDKGIKNSEIGDIPKDWIVYEFDSISNIYNGYSYKGNELQQSNSAMVTIKNFNRDGSFRTDGFKEISYSNKVKDYHFVNEYDVLISCTDVTQDADIIGNCIILLDKKEYDDLIMSMDLVKIESKKKEINNFLLASILKSYRFKMHILGYVNGTTVLHLDKKGIKKFKLALPDDLSILKDLNDILENNYKQIAINQKEINKLQKLRDALLPKLMSGEIDVSKINCDLNYLIRGIELILDLYSCLTVSDNFNIKIIIVILYLLKLIIIFKLLSDNKFMLLLDIIMIIIELIRFILVG